MTTPAVRWDGFHVFPVTDAIRRAPRSAGVAAIILTSLSVVALDGLLPAVGDALQVTSNALVRHEYWRLFTYVLPHEGGWAHVVLNMCVLGLYGWQLERIVGTVRLIGVYFVGGAIAMAALASFRPINAATGLRSGASLAVYAVVAATAVTYMKLGMEHRPDVLRAAGTMAVLLVLGGIIPALRRRGVAVSSVPTGFGGLVYGFVNHSLGTGAGLLLGVAIRSPTKRSEIARS